MNGLSRTTYEEFIKVFFGPGNDFTLQMVESPHAEPSAGQRYVRARLDDLRTGANVPIVVPRVQGRTTYWYAVTYETRQFRRLGQELQGAVGPTYSDFEPLPAALSEIDPVEGAVLSLTDPQFIYRFATPTDLIQSVIPALESLYLMWDARPHREFSTVRPFGRILRDFRLSTQQGDRLTAEGLLRRLIDDGFLSATNVAFLRIQMLSATGGNDELLGLPELHSVLRVRRPWPVTEAILRAVYAKYLSTVLSLDQARDIYNNQVRPQFSRLAATAHEPTDAQTALLMLLEALEQEPANKSALLRIEESGWDRSSLPFPIPLDYLRINSNPQTLETGVNSIQQALDQGLWERAFDLAEGSNLTLPSVAAMVRSAYELGSPDLADRALRAFNTLPEESREGLDRSRVVRLQLTELRLLAEELPGDWLQWFRLLAVEPSPDTLARLRRAVDQGGMTSPTSDQVAELSDAIVRDRSPDGKALVSTSLPELLSGLYVNSEDTYQFVPLYLSALDQLIYEADYTEPVLSTIMSLIELTVGLGLSKEAYRVVLSSGYDVWKSIQSLGRVDWLLDLVSVLTYSPKPDPKSCDAWLAEAFAWLVQNQRQLATEQDHRITILAERVPDLGVVWRQPPATPLVEPGPNLNGMKLGIYSLSEASARGARDMLEVNYPGAKVVLNHDKKATEALRSMASSCDIVVATWASAKHSATGALVRHLGRRTALRWATGTGASSIYQAFVRPA